MSAGMNAVLWPLRCLGIVMEPDPSDPCQAAGVLNPAVARGPGGCVLSYEGLPCITTRGAHPSPPLEGP
jgi:hypothetical protein